MTTPSGGSPAACATGGELWGTNGSAVAKRQSATKRCRVRRLIPISHHARWSRVPLGGGQSLLALVLQRLQELKPCRIGREGWEFG